MKLVEEDEGLVGESKGSWSKATSREYGAYSCERPNRVWVITYM